MTENSSLSHFFSVRKHYNEKFLNYDNLSTEDKIEWTKKYLLGLASEVDAVLDEIPWKSNRNLEFSPNRTNIGLEIVDLFNFVNSLFLLWGFNPGEIQDLHHMKQMYLDLRYKQEYNPLPFDKIFMYDLDGCAADFRYTFINWMKRMDSDIKVVEDAMVSLHIDIDLGIETTFYESLKYQFESEGGYARLRPNQQVIDKIKDLRWSGLSPVVVTARPFKRLQRCAYDTIEWLVRNEVPYDQLVFDVEKVLFLNRDHKNKVKLCIEDDPNTAMRLAIQGYKVLLISYPYNLHVSHPNLHRFTLNELEGLDIVDFVEMVNK